jgi:hypothetical protein
MSKTKCIIDTLEIRSDVQVKQHCIRMMQMPSNQKEESESMKSFGETTESLSGGKNRKAKIGGRIEGRIEVRQRNDVVMTS